MYNHTASSSLTETLAYLCIIQVDLSLPSLALLAQVNIVGSPGGCGGQGGGGRPGDGVVFAMAWSRGWTYMVKVKGCADLRCFMRLINRCLFISHLDVMQALMW